MRTVLALAGMMLALGLSAPLIRLVQADPLWILAGRVVLAWPFVAVVAWKKRNPWPWRAAFWPGFGLFLHWFFWVLAIQHTAISHASMLIGTGALWATVLSRSLLQETVQPRAWLGLGVACAGMGLLFLWGESSHTNAVESALAVAPNIYGNLAALAGAAAFVGYSFAGRKARQKYPFWGYSTALYGWAALWALLVLAVVHPPIPEFTGRDWFGLVGVALLPTLIGHGTLNALLGSVPAARVALWTMAEPIPAMAIAALAFGEIPNLWTIAGGCVVMLGVALGTLGPTRKRA